MTIKNKELSYKTKEQFEFIDITDEVCDFVKESAVKNGLVNIQTLHTTAALMLNENEPLLLKDIKNNLEKHAPQDMLYNHDNFTVRTVNMCNDECANGHAHCKAVYLPVNICLNLVAGKLQLGQWQRIFFVELDRSRIRKVHIQIIGE